MISMSGCLSARLAAAGVWLSAAGTATVAQARDSVDVSIGANVAPGVAVGVSNAPPMYYPPVYVQPAPIYYEPAPVYVRPAPVYYGAAPIYYDRGHRHGHRNHWRNEHRRHGGHGYGRR